MSKRMKISKHLGVYEIVFLFVLYEKALSGTTQLNKREKLFLTFPHRGIDFGAA